MKVVPPVLADVLHPPRFHVLCIGLITTRALAEHGEMLDEWVREHVANDDQLKQCLHYDVVAT